MSAGTDCQIEVVQPIEALTLGLAGSVATTLCQVGSARASWSTTIPMMMLTIGLHTETLATNSL